MKRLLVFLVLSVFLISGCGSESPATAAGVTVDEYKIRINEALKQAGDQTTLKIINEDVLEDGKISLALSNNIFIFLRENEDGFIDQYNLAMASNAFMTETENFRFAFLLLIGTVDESLSFGDRNLVLRDLGISHEDAFFEEHTKVITNNDIQYTYKGSFVDNYVLRAEYK